MIKDDKEIQIYKSEVFEKKKFSIVVPVYNIEVWLPKCLRSIAKQTDKNFELILVNDGSTDGCKDICMEYAKTHDNVMVINKPNGGLVSARNAGVMMASGEYICPVDGDDWINKDYIKCINWCFNVPFDEPVDSIDMVIFPHMTVYKDNAETHIPIDSVGLLDRDYLEKNVFTYIFNLNTFLSAWSIACKTELLKKHLCKNETITMHEDFAYTYELFYNTRNVFVTQKILYYYNQMNESSITHINGLSNNFLSRLRAIIYIYGNMKECERYIKNQLCTSFFLIMTYDFYEFTDLKQVKEFKKNLTPEHIENLYVATAIILGLLNKDVKYYRSIKWGCYLMLAGHCRTLYKFIQSSKKRFYKKLIY